MKNFYSALLLILALSSCSTAISSPSIQYRNSSPDGSEVRNIKVVWNGYRLLESSGPYYLCWWGGGQSFALRKRSDLFGPVHAEWENAIGKKVSKDFVFNESDFPSFAKGKSYRPNQYPQIILFFTQTDVEYYTSDNPNIENIERTKKGNWTIKWFEEEGKHRCVNDPKEVQRLRAK